MVTKTTIPAGPIDCACVIHGDAYDWTYVDRLYNMLTRHISVGVKLHVYTEATRPVPSHMIKHALTDWKFGGPKKAWWYKMQMFNAEHHVGPLLYFDLDVVIVKNIDWIHRLPLQYFWSIRDFKYLWRSSSNNMNSSTMWWDTRKFAHVWDDFNRQNLSQIIRKYHGDQDYLSDAILQNERRFFEIDRIQSWRWQALDGGYNFKQRRYATPGAGTEIADRTSVLIFHGNPKPNQIQDSVIVQHWQ